MSADEILKILDSLTKYVVYFYPGYITIYVFYFLKAYTLDDRKEIIPKTIALSFFYKLFLDKIPMTSQLTYHCLMLTLSIVIPYLCYQIQQSEEFANLLNFLNIDTRFEDNELDLLDKGEFAPWLIVYLKDDNVIYAGFLGERELEVKKRKFITLKKYRKYYIENHQKPKILLEKHDDDDEIVIIYYESIKRIEKMKT